MAALREGPPSRLDQTSLQPTLNWSPPTTEDTSGALAARLELLVPTELRRTLRTHAFAMEAVIKLSTPRTPAGARAPGLCRDAATRQKRRRTWSERLQHYALVDKAQVEVEFFHPGPLKAILKHEIQENAMSYLLVQNDADRVGGACNAIATLVWQRAHLTTTGAAVAADVCSASLLAIDSKSEMRKAVSTFLDYLQPASAGPRSATRSTSCATQDRAVCQPSERRLFSSNLKKTTT